MTGESDQTEPGIGAIEAETEKAFRDQPTNRDLARKLIQVHTRTGRAADALAVLGRHPTLLDDPDTLSCCVESMAVSGQVDALLNAKILNRVLAAPNELMATLGPNLLRCVAQLVARNVPSPEIDQFLRLLAGSNIPANTPHIGPLILRVFQARFQARSAHELVDHWEALGTKLPWARLALERGSTKQSPAARDLLRGHDRQTLFPEKRVLLRMGTGRFKEAPQAISKDQADKLGLSLAPLDPEILNRNLNALIPELTKHAQELGIGLPDCAPILVLSTGRTGTRSLNALIEALPSHESFHFFNLHQEAGDLNLVFHALLQGDKRPEIWVPALRRFWHDRGHELSWCAANKIRPVIVNHLDMAQLPFYLTLFPDLSILHIDRDPGKTLISHAYKSQFQYQQVRPLYVRIGSLFEYARPQELDLEQNVAWFMTATEMIAKVVQHRIQNNLAGDLVNFHRQFLHLDMNLAFSQEPAELEKFRQVFGSTAPDLNTLAQHFGTIINEKSHYSVPSELRDVEKARSIFQHHRDALFQSGYLG